MPDDARSGHAVFGHQQAGELCGAVDAPLPHPALLVLHADLHADAVGVFALAVVRVPARTLQPAAAVPRNPVVRHGLPDLGLVHKIVGGRLDGLPGEVVGVILGRVAPVGRVMDDDVRDRACPHAAVVRAVAELGLNLRRAAPT